MLEELEVPASHRQMFRRYHQICIPEKHAGPKPKKGIVVSATPTKANRRAYELQGTELRCCIIQRTRTRQCDKRHYNSASFHQGEPIVVGVKVVLEDLDNVLRRDERTESIDGRITVVSGMWKTLIF